MATLKSNPKAKVLSFSILELRKMIFSLILFSDENEIENITELIKKIHQFNLKTRCFGIKKRKMPKSKAK